MRRLEICANSIESAINAQEGGADRIELCFDLSIGGVTPDHGVIKQVRELLHIPVYVLIRPRGGDFVYSQREVERMIKDIEFCAENRCSGVVIGALSRNGQIDVPTTTQFLTAAGFMDVTFHRAFDDTKNHLEALETLKEVGIQRILTSGGGKTALEGIDRIEELLEEAGNEVVIMPGGGIRPDNIELLKQTGAREFHSSALTAGGSSSDTEMIRSLASKLE